MAQEKDKHSLGPPVSFDFRYLTTVDRLCDLWTAVPKNTFLIQLFLAFLIIEVAVVFYTGEDLQLNVGAASS